MFQVSDRLFNTISRGLILVPTFLKRILKMGSVSPLVTWGLGRFRDYLHFSSRFCHGCIFGGFEYFYNLIRGNSRRCVPLPRELFLGVLAWVNHFIYGHNVGLLGDLGDFEIFHFSSRFCHGCIFGGLEYFYNLIRGNSRRCVPLPREIFLGVLAWVNHFIYGHNVGLKRSESLKIYFSENVIFEDVPGLRSTF